MSEYPTLPPGPGRVRLLIVKVARAILPRSAVRFVRAVLSRQAFEPGHNRVDFGDLRRTAPISRRFGAERGKPVDRYYVEKFLGSHKATIKGVVLEIGEDVYTRRFGGDQVRRIEVLHYDDPSPPATIIADLTDAPHIPSNEFDCIIITQTLMLIYDLPRAMETIHRILKPGGVVIATLPGLSQIADTKWPESWYWWFTKFSARRLFEDAFRGGHVEVESFGNVLTTIAHLHGLARDELTPEEYEVADPQYQMLIGVFARKGDEPSLEVDPETSSVGQAEG